MLQAIYCSTATRRFSEDELLELLEKARIKNARLEITGMLIYDQGMFMQVIEGPKENIEGLLLHLLDDPRHHRVRILSTKAIEVREFGYWEMAFFRENNLKEQADGYLDLHSMKEEFTIETSMATQMLTLFQEGLFKDTAEGHEDPVGSCTITIRSTSPAHRHQRHYLVELGRAMAVALPDVPIVVAAKDGEFTFNQMRELYCGEVEIF
ncbi:BLUF domain-containing protein [Rhodovastum atsumiense]|nr:BLUF domain-containing protein [Rhodovastum atsumiense]CAH2602576.1 BLUF domain-containing protein [Rhodovastum atsumiense]